MNILNTNAYAAAATPDFTELKKEILQQPPRFSYGNATYDAFAEGYTAEPADGRRQPSVAGLCGE